MNMISQMYKKVNGGYSSKNKTPGDKEGTGLIPLRELRGKMETGLVFIRELTDKMGTGLVSFRELGEGWSRRGLVSIREKGVGGKKTCFFHGTHS
jgi:hypothetical protein